MAFSTVGGRTQPAKTYSTPPTQVGVNNPYYVPSPPMIPEGAVQPGGTYVSTSAGRTYYQTVGEGGKPTSISVEQPVEKQTKELDVLEGKYLAGSPAKPELKTTTTPLGAPKLQLGVMTFPAQREITGKETKLSQTAYTPLPAGFSFPVTRSLALEAAEKQAETKAKAEYETNLKAQLGGFAYQYQKDYAAGKLSTARMEREANYLQKEGGLFGLGMGAVVGSAAYFGKNVQGLTVWTTQSLIDMPTSIGLAISGDSRTAIYTAARPIVTVLASPYSVASSFLEKPIETSFGLVGSSYFVGSAYKTLTNPIGKFIKSAEYGTWKTEYAQGSFKITRDLTPFGEVVKGVEGLSTGIKTRLGFIKEVKTPQWVKNVESAQKAVEITSGYSKIAALRFQTVSGVSTAIGEFGQKVTFFQTPQSESLFFKPNEFVKFNKPPVSSQPMRVTYPKLASFKIMDYQEPVFVQKPSFTGYLQEQGQFISSGAGREFASMKSNFLNSFQEYFPTKPTASVPLFKQPKMTDFVTRKMQPMTFETELPGPTTTSFVPDLGKTAGGGTTVQIGFKTVSKSYEAPAVMVTKKYLDLLDFKTEINYPKTPEFGWVVKTGAPNKGMTTFAPNKISSAPPQTAEAMKDLIAKYEGRGGISALSKEGAPSTISFGGDINALRSYLNARESRFILPQTNVKTGTSGLKATADASKIGVGLKTTGTIGLTYKIKSQAGQVSSSILKEISKTVPSSLSSIKQVPSTATLPAQATSVMQVEATVQLQRQITLTKQTPFTYRPPKIPELPKPSGGVAVFYGVPQTVRKKLRFKMPKMSLGVPKQYRPSIAGFELRIKSPKGFKLRKLTGIEVRGI